MRQKFEFIQLSTEELEQLLNKVIDQKLFQVQFKASPTEKLLSRHEAAKFLNVGLTTLNKLKKQKKVKPIYIGNKVLYKESSLLSFIDSMQPHNQ